jgi:hypothetical protein
MDNDKLKINGIIGVGVLASSLVIGIEASTYSTMLNPRLDANSESSNAIISENYSNYIKNIFSLPSQRIKIDMVVDEDDYPEADVIEVPVVKRMLFQFKKPVKLEFS